MPARSPIHAVAFAAFLFLGTFQEAPGFRVAQIVPLWPGKPSQIIFKKDARHGFLVHTTHQGLKGGALIGMPKVIKADLTPLASPCAWRSLIKARPARPSDPAASEARLPSREVARAFAGMARHLEALKEVASS